MKNIITVIIVLAVIGLVAFLYMTRPVAAPTQSTESAVENLATSSSATIYRIASERSEVQFSIGELLNGAPFTAVGKTSEVAGEVSVSSTAVSVGSMAVNATTFKTDNSRRDGAIVRLILKSDQPGNEFITFKPAQPIVLAAPLAEGQEVNAVVSGDLTISGVTKPASFSVRLKLQGQELVVMGDTTIKRSDFDLKIPQLSFVASVDDEVKVSLSLIAEAVK